jgi:hypothetical protein
MTVKRGLKDIVKHNKERDEARAAAQARREEGNRPSRRWFKILDGQSVNVVFLQELDEDSPNFSEKNGLGVLAIEHNNPAPGMWMKKALCTIDEGACWACEQHKADFTAGWKQKEKFYINVLVTDGVDKAGQAEDPYVAVLSQGNSGRSITPTLLDYAVDDGTITDKAYVIKRVGSELSDTSYSIRQKKEHGLNVEDYDLYDLDEVLRKVPYEQQEAFYLDGQSAEKKEPSEVPKTAAEVDLDW